jgi:hypothetical protein
MAEHVTLMGERSGIYRVTVRKAEGKRPLVRPMRRWEDNIKMGIQEIGWGLGLVAMAQNGEERRVVVNAVMNLRVP